MKSSFIHSIYKYLNDKISNKERYALEKEINTDPFLQDAMDGFAQLSADDLETDLSKLQQQLNNKQSTKTRKLIPYFKIAASIVLFIGIGSVILYLSSNMFTPNLAEQTSKEIPKEKSVIKIEPEPLTETIELEKSEDKAIANTFTKTTPQSEKKKYTVPKKSASRNHSIVTKKNLISEENIESEGNAIIAKSTEIALLDTINETPSISNAIEGRMAGISITRSEQTSSAPRVFEKKKKNKETNVIKGKIIDDSNLPLAGAMVVIDGVSKGVISDIDGNFSINADSADQLKIAFIGYEEVKLNTEELRAMNNEIQLKADVLALDEVVVVGYGTQKKSITTGAVRKVSSSNISPHNKQTPDYEPPPKKYKAKKILLTYKSDYETVAAPKDGIKEFEKQIKKNFKYESLFATKIVVNFFVEIDGSLSKITVVDSPSVDYSNEIIRLLNENPEWTPSVIDGKKIKEIITMTILFK